MQLTTRLFLFFSILLLSACNGESAIDDTRSKPNSFAGVKNPAKDFSPGSTGDSNNTGGLSPAGDEVRITLELPANLAPGGEPTRRNLRIVQPDFVRVYKIDRNLAEVGSVSYSTRLDDEGYTIIKFESGRQPMAPDVVIEASYGNTTLRSLATDDDRDIKINPFSEYLLRTTLPNYTPGEFNQLVECADPTSDTLCLNKLVWPALADQIHDFEIDIPADASIEGAIDLLSRRADLASYVASAARYPLLEDQADGISAYAAEYNSVFMGLELGQTFLESSSAGSGQWGIRMGREKQTSETTYLYPGSTLQKSDLDFVGIKLTHLATQIPYDRKTLIHKKGDQFFPRTTDNWELNTHEASPGAATLDSDTRLLAIRALYQSITGRNGANTIGWTRNPYYLDAFTSEPMDTNSGPDRVLGGYFSAGKAIQLESKQGKFERKSELESHYVSALELNLMRQEGFNLSTLDGKEYNTLYLALRFSDSETPLQIESGSGSWTINTASNSSTITQSQTYTTLTRGSSGAVQVGSNGNHPGNWTLSSRTSRLSDGDKNIGRLNLDVNTPTGPFSQPDLGVGASVPDGSLMAFNLVDATSGSGIIGDGLFIASEKALGAPTTGRYKVQGFVLGLDAGHNRLIHLDGGTLELSGIEASLSSNTFEVTHSVNSETVSVPLSAELSAQLSYSHTGDGKVSFTADSLALEGFVSADQNQFFLLYQDSVNGEEQRGLLMATKLP